MGSMATLFNQDNPIGWGIATIGIILIVLIQGKIIRPFTQNKGFLIVIIAMVSVVALIIPGLIPTGTSIPTAPSKIISPFTGTWVNQNPLAKTFTKLAIAGEPDHLEVEVTGYSGKVGTYKATLSSENQLTIPPFKYLERATYENTTLKLQSNGVLSFSCKATLSTGAIVMINDVMIKVLKP